jgi:hypothetical protein
LGGFIVSALPLVMLRLSHYTPAQLRKSYSYKILARYKQFHSRVGDVYKFTPLGDDSVRQVLARPDLLGTDLTAETFPEAVVPAVITATQGNFRKIKMLVRRVERILALNQMEVATPHVVRTANGQLLPGLD